MVDCRKPGRPRVARKSFVQEQLLWRRRIVHLCLVWMEYQIVESDGPTMDCWVQACDSISRLMSSLHQFAPEWM
eukprot:1295353-Prorocentrum_lima.AAC.1